MNATSLYVSTSKLVLQADEDSSTWQDLYRLVPYLRQSLSCTVCGNLLIEPHSPTETNCQHHVCRSCKGGRKKLKPSCSWCKDYDSYVENVLLRILLQCYKKLCMYIRSSAIYRNLVSNNSCAGSNGNIVAGTSSLVELINEGAGFVDEFKSTAGLSKSAYSILPCLYTSPATQSASTSNVTAPALHTMEIPAIVETKSPPQVQTNGSSLYSVFNIGNKMALKQTGSSLPRQQDEETSKQGQSPRSLASKISSNTGFKKPQNRLRLSLSKGNLRNKTAQSRQMGGSGGRESEAATGTGSAAPAPAPAAAPAAVATANKRRGCRCGNATATPGKLTCCGQRCPCYVESKACVDCRCKGCRNPHRPGGHKVRPHFTQLETYEMRLGPVTTTSVADMGHIQESTGQAHQLGSASQPHQATDMIDLGPADLTSLATPEQLAATNAGATLQVLGVYTTQLHSVTSALPATLLVGDDTAAFSRSSEEETSDVDVDF